MQGKDMNTTPLSVWPRRGKHEYNPPISLAMQGKTRIQLLYQSGHAGEDMIGPQH